MSQAIPSSAEMPAHMPLYPDGLQRRICRLLLRLCGWRLAGQFPDLPKAVLIAAPHSSWWDGVWGLLMKVAIGAEVHFMGKEELFRGPLGNLLRRLGGMPIDRAASLGVVDQMVAQFHQRERFWLGIAPEGTRRQVARWRSGFWHIADQAGVPIVPAYFNYADRTIGIGPPLVTSGDMAADIARLQAFYVPFKGKHRDV